MENVTGNPEGNELQMAKRYSTTYDKIQWTAVESSTIDSVSYEAEKQELRIHFKTKKPSTTFYVYAGVSQEEVDEMLKAESVGSHFAKQIKSVKNCSKVDEHGLMADVSIAMGKK